jgi:GTP pyrophosphokinase
MGDNGMMAEKAQDALAATPAEGAKPPTVPAAMTPAASAPAPAKKSAVPDAANFRVLEEAARAYLDDDEWAKIDRAYHFAADYHRDQRRRSGEPYINHPVEVALILCKDLHMDEDTICAALLHDTVEDTPATLTQISDLFGETVAELVDGVTKLTSIKVTSMDEKQALNLRKMFLAMSKDIRVVIIKLADRLHNMRTLAALPPDRRLFKARETMDVYAPLADRLGISSIKWELEDLAFFWLEPEEYQRVARMVQDSRAQREHDTEEAIKTLDDELKRVGLKNYQITGRPKHLWSIYQKMTRKGREFSDIYDLIALRVITQTVGDCYSALGAVHTLWHPCPAASRTTSPRPRPTSTSRSTPRWSVRTASPSRSRSARSRCTSRPSTASPPTGSTRRPATPRARCRADDRSSTLPSTGSARASTGPSRTTSTTRTSS